MLGRTGETSRAIETRVQSVLKQKEHYFRLRTEPLNSARRKQVIRQRQRIVLRQRIGAFVRCFDRKDFAVSNGLA